MDEQPPGAKLTLVTPMADVAFLNLWHYHPHGPALIQIMRGRGLSGRAFAATGQERTFNN